MQACWLVLKSRDHAGCLIYLAFTTSVSPQASNSLMSTHCKGKGTLGKGTPLLLAYLNFTVLTSAARRRAIAC